jgi:hypothetical protein
VSLLATVLHKKCQQADKFSQELSSSLDLNTVLNCLEEWYKQWPQHTLTLRVMFQLEKKKLALAILATPQPQSTQAQTCCTATQTQLSSLLQMLETEERAGNQMPGIADH